MKIYVGNLSFETNDSDLSAAFAAHGSVRSASVVMDRDTGRSRGFGFVEMGDDEAKAAIDALNGAEMGGRQLAVSEAKPRENRGFGGGGGGGGGGRGRR